MNAADRRVVVEQAGRDIVAASTHPWSTEADVRMSQRLIDDVAVLARIVGAGADGVRWVFVTGVFVGAVLSMLLAAVLP